VQVVDRVVPGSFLVASPLLRDPNFVHTVVLLCDHGSGGSWGLVVNRRTNLAFGDLLEALPFPAAATGPVHWGGPCESSRLQILHRLRRDTRGSLPVCRNVELGLEVDRLKSILVDPLHPGEALHGYVGYAGWGAEQLAKEVAERSWVACTADARLVFDTPHEEIWERSLESLGPPWSRLARVPIVQRLN
jgi:putative transcriptional regulator